MVGCHPAAANAKSAYKRTLAHTAGVKAAAAAAAAAEWVAPVDSTIRIGHPNSADVKHKEHSEWVALVDSTAEFFTLILWMQNIKNNSKIISSKTPEPPQKKLWLSDTRRFSKVCDQFVILRREPWDACCLLLLRKSAKTTMVGLGQVGSQNFQS